MRCFKKIIENKCVCFQKVTRLMTMKMRLKMKNKSDRYDINRPTIMEIILWDFLMLYQIFLLPQVKRSAIISNKQGVYEVPQELPNDLRLRTLEK